MQVDLVIQHNVDERWADIEPEVQRVVAKACHGEFTAEDVRELIEKGRFYAAYSHKGSDVKMVCVWEMVYYPTLTAVNICCLGGRDIAGSWARYGDTMRHIWRAQGAKAVECSVSRAMARLLQQAGFIAKPIYTVMRGEI